MIYDSELGIVHDTYFYFVMAYKEGSLKEKIRGWVTDPTDEFEYYNKIKRLVPPLPDSLYIFFYSDESRYSAMTEVFNDFLCYCRRDYNGYIGLLKNKCYLKKKLITNFFPKAGAEQYKILINDENPQKFYELLSGLNLPDKMNYQFQYAIELFDGLADELVSLMNTINTAVRKMYGKYRDKLLEFARRTDQCSVELISKLFNVSEQRVVSAYLAVTLFYPQTFMMEHKDLNIFILGLKYEESMEIVKNKNISLYSASKIFSDPGKTKVVELFMTQQSYCTNDIMSLLNLSRSTVSHYFNDLSAEKIISPYEVINEEYYYKLNHEYFDALQKSAEALKLKAQGKQ